MMSPGLPAGTRMQSNVQFLRPPERETPSESDLSVEDLEVFISAQKFGEEFRELHLRHQMTDAMMRAGAEGDVAALIAL